MWTTLCSTQGWDRCDYYSQFITTSHQCSRTCLLSTLPAGRVGVGPPSSYIQEGLTQNSSPSTLFSCPMWVSCRLKFVVMVNFMCHLGENVGIFKM